jgi:hypothetical protein
VVGVSINTSAMGEDEALSYLAETEKRMGLPTCDPFRQGAARLADALGTTEFRPPDPPGRRLDLPRRDANTGKAPKEPE